MNEEFKNENEATGKAEETTEVKKESIFSKFKKTVSKVGDVRVRDVAKIGAIAGAGAGAVLLCGKLFKGGSETEYESSHEEYSSNDDSEEEESKE